MTVYRLAHWSKKKFECPICGFSGPFADIAPATGPRRHAQCPDCGALERHRLQYLVVHSVFAGVDTSMLRVLHVAPEDYFRILFKKKFKIYETTDLMMENVDYRADLTELPFPTASYDVVFASHVLEHIKDDQQAIAEVRRILRPGGVAFLPVPIVAEKTIEYPEPNERESGHVRAPGVDYFLRYTPFFARVEEYSSFVFADKYQLFVYEDREGWPPECCPLLLPMKGERHVDIVPACYA